QLPDNNDKAFDYNKTDNLYFEVGVACKLKNIQYVIRNCLVGIYVFVL
ncbi:19371_t:CDS:2, partial [Dentiscutata erythropus]